MDSGEEIRWEFEAVRVGQTGTAFTVEVTDELIAMYAETVRNPNPEYADSGGEGGGDGRLKLAMPTMIFRIAPLRRRDIAAANGFTALEWVSENPRQTPFAKCDVRWFSRFAQTTSSPASGVWSISRSGGGTSLSRSVSKPVTRMTKR